MKWRIEVTDLNNEIPSRDQIKTVLFDPAGRSVFVAVIHNMEQDANEFWVDQGRLLSALNGPPAE
jgi:hypothetical protein